MLPNRGMHSFKADITWANTIILKKDPESHYFYLRIPDHFGSQLLMQTVIFVSRVMCIFARANRQPKALISDKMYVTLIFLPTFISCKDIYERKIKLNLYFVKLNIISKNFFVRTVCCDMNASIKFHLISYKCTGKQVQLITVQSRASTINALL